MKSLLTGKFERITKEIGFLECDVESAATTYYSWQTEILRPLGMRIELNNAEGSLELVLRSLLPLTTPVRCRCAFVPTQSKWTAYFDNGATGTDAAGLVTVMGKWLGCRGIRTVYVPNTIPPRPTRETNRRFGATILEVYGPDAKASRVVYVANDGGKWRFGQSGIPFPFEEADTYNTNPISNRFTGEMLDRYLKHLGVAAFDEKFYAPNGCRSIVARKCGKLPSGLREVSLD